MDGYVMSERTHAFVPLGFSCEHRCDCVADVVDRFVSFRSLTICVSPAEEYHQDYYIKNPGNYGYYKNACRRPQRLKEVWGEEEYQCYHEEEHTCFIEMLDGSNTTLADAGLSVPQVLNEDGEFVDVESNIKNADAEKANKFPVYFILEGCIGAVVLVGMALFYDYKTGKLGCVKRMCSPVRQEEEPQVA